MIIDEACNAADRSRDGRVRAARSVFAELLLRQADSLVLLTGTPHDGSPSQPYSAKMLDVFRAMAAAPAVERLQATGKCGINAFTHTNYYRNAFHRRVNLNSELSLILSLYRWV